MLGSQFQLQFCFDLGQDRHSKVCELQVRHLVLAVRQHSSPLFHDHIDAVLQGLMHGLCMLRSHWAQF